MQAGRPAIDERWTAADLQTLLGIFDEEFDKVRRQGRAGLDIYMGHDRNLLRADLATFLDKDSDYRIEHGVVPSRVRGAPLQAPPSTASTVPALSTASTARRTARRP